MEISYGSVTTKDPIELHIIDQLVNEKKKNERLMSHVEKTGSWFSLKKVQAWKPYDFYHYFCSKYNQRYKKEYKLRGSIIVCYSRIESFMLANDISNVEYKEFIDKAFSIYFNAICIPEVASICSPSLYAHMSHKRARSATSKDLFDLDKAIAKENEKFRTYLEKHA